MIFLLILLGNNHVESAVTENVALYEPIYRTGDDLNWKNNHIDVGEWSSIYSGLPENTGRYWVRIPLKITLKQVPTQHSVFSSILGSYEVYWNGILIANSGISGDSKDLESPGPVMKISVIPLQLWTEGDHLLSLRISNYHAPETLRKDYFNLLVLPSDEAKKGALAAYLSPLFSLGAIFIVAVFFFLVYVIYTPDKVYLIFSVTCFVVVSLIIAESWKELVGYSYDWHLFRLRIISALTFVVCAFLHLLFLTQFNITNKLRWLLLLVTGLVGILVLTPSFDQQSLYMLMYSFGLMLILSLISCVKQIQGAVLGLLAASFMLLCLVMMPKSFPENLFFLSYIGFVVIELISLIRRMKSTNNKKNEALMIAAQLETALLKKNIQPHFMLNTLTSIEQWIVEAPDIAIDFIDSLANEFKLLNSVSDKNLIELNQEIELCRHHLKIMGFRKVQQYVLITEAIDSSLLIPPAVIHTLIENILSHNIFQDEVVKIKLVQQEPNAGNTVILKLSSKFTPNLPSKKIKSGMGLKYIHARLNESYGDHWKLTENQKDGMWLTCIKIPRIKA